MVRLPRLVLPGIPYHVTQRGNRRARTFFEDGDYALYRDLLAQAADCATAAGLVATFGYDALGRRITRTANQSLIGID